MLRDFLTPRERVGAVIIIATAVGTTISLPLWGAALATTAAAKLQPLLDTSGLARTIIRTINRRD